MATKKKKTEEQVQIPDQYTLVAADLSLKRPGFCVMHISKEGSAAQIKNCSLISVDNKTKTKPRGQLLEEIGCAFKNILDNTDGPLFLAREQSINNCGGKMAHSSTAARTGASAVVGVMDLLGWQKNHTTWEEIYPTTIKKTLTGSGKAEKQAVAEALASYIGEQTYKNDDESDAAAVAITWLIKHDQIKQINPEEQSSE